NSSLGTSTTSTTISNITTTSSSNISTTTTTKITTSVTTTTTQRKPYLVSDIPNNYEINVETIMQYPELPTGCEITSLTILLQSLDFDVSKETMASEYLVCKDTLEYSLNEAFIGNPFTSAGYGCFAPVLVKAADNYLKDQKSDYIAKDLTGSRQKTILRYIASGHPVVMWETLYLNDVYISERWTSSKGEETEWCDMEHCVLLRGYDLENDIVYVCDPMQGDVTYSLTRYFEIYDDMGRRAMTIY
ncbi:MAG: C39 family peptidase, partial [Ruminococcus sp.]|nr:C39 family peptidase [Ruminococcus sp.]